MGEETVNLVSDLQKHCQNSICGVKHSDSVVPDVKTQCKRCR